MTKFVLHAIIEEEMLNRLKISKTEQIFFKGAVTAAVLLAGIFALFYGIPCPFAKMGIPCFGCGMTHAFRAALSLDFSAALSLDFSAAFRANGMFWSVPLLWAYWVADFRLFSKKAVNDGFFAAIIVGYIVDYCLRIIL